MNRKEFLTNSTLAVAGLTSLLASSCKNANSETKSPEVTPVIGDNFELNEATISDLQANMASGDRKSVV